MIILIHQLLFPCNYKRMEVDVACFALKSFNDLCGWRQVFKHYIEELEEESLRDNFVVVVRRQILNFVLLVPSLEP